MLNHITMKIFKNIPETNCPRTNVQVVEPFCVGGFLFMEIWKDIKGYEGLYQVSNLGNVKSNLRKKGLLNLVTDNKGYHQVNLSLNGVVKRHKIHRLVLSEFSNLDSSMFVDHINGIRSDNRLENLRPCTLEQNMRFNNIKKKKTSKYVGVCLKPSGKWCAQIQIAKKKIGLGYYKTEEEAHNAYLLALKQYGL
jgi:hypothetical protein